ncbi:MAG: GDSL-type esterase/lipase family protein [Treponema sp.]|nr:GDSL-type esterase/lipase family protein [Treponema sp.]
MIPCRNKALLPVLALLLFAGCNIFTGTDKQNMNQNNEIYQVRVTIGSGARTILPDLAAGFSKFEIGAEPASGNTQNPPAPVTVNGGTQGTISLPLGDWNIIVTGYVSAAGIDYPAVKGSAPLKVTGSSHSVNVPVNMPETGGTGTFACTVNFPDGGSAHVRLEPWPIGGAPVVDAAVAASGTPVTQSVPSGIYFLTVTASVNTTTSYTRNEIVHIYPQTASNAAYRFNEPGADTLVSRGRPTITNTGVTAPQLVDGLYLPATWPETWRPNAGGWVSIDVGAGTGITELILLWTASHIYDHNDTGAGAPTSYRIHTSSDSSNGNPNNGTWNEVVTVTGNAYRTRTHKIPFTGQRWVRFQIPNPYSGPQVMINEIELHDNTDEKVDGWLFFGDSITAHAFNRHTDRTPAFADLVWDDGKGSHRPMQINAGVGGDKAAWAYNRLEETLAQNDGIRVVAICLGTNDHDGRLQQQQEYRENMRALIRLAARPPYNKKVIVPAIPWTEDGRDLAPIIQMNLFIEQLRIEEGLPLGPDFYTLFLDPDDEYPALFPTNDLLHPNDLGYRLMNKWWADAYKEAMNNGTLPKP